MSINLFEKCEIYSFVTAAYCKLFNVGPLVPFLVPLVHFHPDGRGLFPCDSTPYTLCKSSLNGLIRIKMKWTPTHFNTCGRFWGSILDMLRRNEVVLASHDGPIIHFFFPLICHYTMLCKVCFLCISVSKF